jgi:hypothetical protein
MKQFLLVAFMTIIGFAAGFGGRVWQERHAPLPPPPGTFLSEFGGPRAQSHDHPLDRAQLIAEIAKMKPQIEAYTARMSAIDDEFNKSLQTVLTDEQKNAASDRQKKHDAEKSGRPAPDNSKPLSDDQITHLRQRPFHAMVFTVVIPLKLDELNHEYHFDDAQTAKVTSLLKTRRDEFLSLVDSVPPPSLELSRLAPEVTRLAEPAK